MIDPANITNFHRTEAELEEFLLFCLCVNGKKSAIQSVKLDAFLFNSRLMQMSPFEWVEHLLKIGDKHLHKALMTHKIGQYTRLVRGFKDAIKLKGRLATCDLHELERIHGLGMKTSRFFLTHSREGQRFAILDVHILRHMREDLGISTTVNTPTTTAKYFELEKKLLDEIEKSGMNHADYDLNVWKTRSVKKELQSN